MTDEEAEDAAMVRNHREQVDAMATAIEEAILEHVHGPWRRSLYVIGCACRLAARRFYDELDASPPDNGPRWIYRGGNMWDYRSENDERVQRPDV
jgi:hypothetical protein